MGDLRDATRNLEQNSLDFVERLDKLDRNLASQNSLNQIVTRIESLDLEEDKNSKRIHPDKSGDTHRKIFVLFEILIKK